jgi:hypothetical protein
MRFAWKAFAGGTILVAAGTVLACSLLVPADETQCATADDCHARGPAFAKAVCAAGFCQLPGDAGASQADANDPWGCLDDTPTPSDPTEEVTVKVILFNAFQPFTLGGSRGGSDLTLLSYTPQPGVTVAACSPLDTVCASPVSGPTSSDDAGIAALRVPGSFGGFYALSQPGSVPTLFYAGRLLDGELTVTYPTSETSSASYSELESAVGISANQDVNAGPGAVSITQLDCNDRRAAGAAFTSSPPPTVTSYLQDFFPSTTAKMTSSDGSGVLVDVPAGSVSITSTLVNQKNRLINAANVAVRPGSLTLVNFRPRAR